jgi:uncharacterized protein YeaO (DUF488 family)
VVRVVRLGSPRAKGEGLRLGTVRRPPAQRLLELLAVLSQQTDFSVGCYCEDEERCHRSILRQLLAEHGARIG